TPLHTFVSDWGQVRDTLVLTYQQNHLSFEFVGIDMLSPGKVMYQWMLEGSEETWSPLSRQTAATYSNIKPGVYTFRIRASNEDGIFSDDQSVHFEILAPFWQKTWFKAAVIAGAVFFLALIFYFRLQAVKRKERERTVRLVLEKDVIELEQKALRLQMNPHFIFNTLNSIQGLIATQDAKTARLYLSKFSKLMRETLENSREALVSVEEEISALTHYLDLEKFSYEQVFDYSIEADDDAHMFMIPPLLVQPFAENAIIHGLIPKGGDGKLTVRFISKDDKLLIEVEDNGVGRKKASEIKSQKTNYHKSTGLQVTQERLDMINNNGEPSIEFIDLQDDQNQPLGTLVRLTVYTSED
ncbi:MAG: histidine kinase, partial [Flavobacteriales bacterium]|nr:histidine kinase [Flavobacteriales bacterium]